MVRESIAAERRKEPESDAEPSFATPYLPTSPHISPHLPISPHVSPYLPTSRCREQVINGVSLSNLYAKLDAGNIEPKELAARQEEARGGALSGSRPRASP